MKKYKVQIKEDKKADIKVKMLKEADPDETMNPIEGDQNLEYAYKYMLRDAKMAGVSQARADLLVMTVLNLYGALKDTKFNTSIEALLNRALKYVYSKIMK